MTPASIPTKISQQEKAHNMVRNILLALAILPSTAQAQTLKWVDNLQITAIEPAAGGWNWIHTDQGSLPCADVGGPALSALQLKMDPAVTFVDGGYDRIYATMLTAMVSNHRVNIRITGSSNGQWCIIERVRIVK